MEVGNTAAECFLIHQPNSHSLLQDNRSHWTFDSCKNKQRLGLKVKFIVHSGCNSNVFYLSRVMSAGLGYTPSKSARVSMIGGG